jgi:hypothetical protein
MSLPIQPAQREKMQSVAQLLDRYFNGNDRGLDRKVGFVLLVFPYGQTTTGCNYISNGADRRDMVALFKDLAARFEGAPDVVGHA